MRRPANKATVISRGAVLITILGTLWTAARAEDDAANETPQRPSIMFNRWQENWSVLADPRFTRNPLDGLKYIPLSPDDPRTYLSFGADLRERFEANDAPTFGIGRNHNNDYLIDRMETHADLRIASQIQIFVQLQSDFAPGKTTIAPVDQNRLDLEQAFIAITEPVADGTLKLRFGRQQFAFDLQRFVSVRDGPNVRQSYDAAWVDYEHGPWRLISFYSQPVQDKDQRAFDDYSSGALTFGGVRLERKFTASSGIAGYFARFNQDNARFIAASGNERRDIVDLRYFGSAAGFDWDLEAMNQTGRIGGKDIEAWAFGTLAGYTFDDVAMTPRIGVQFDGASGNRDSHEFGTFNPLFPNGYYLTLAGYTGYVNFIHLKPSITIHPTNTLKVMFAAAAQWRETTADAVYTQPDIPVSGTAGRPGQYTGTYFQFRADYAITTYASAALELVHFAIGNALRRAGGHDGDYMGLELKCGW
jgi:alginate export protein